MALTREDTIKLLAAIKLEPSLYANAKLPIDNDKLERAIEAARRGDLKPAEKIVDHATSIFRERDMDDDGNKRHKELYLRCLEFIHA